MKRRYLSELYVDSQQGNLIPDCCIGADVIVGFPGENDIDFKRTYDFISSLEISTYMFFHIQKEKIQNLFFC